MSINVTRSSMPDFDEYIEEIRDLWDSHWLTNMGNKHELFRLELEKIFNTPYVTLFVNGHLALENIIAAMQFSKGGEIITTPFTFVSTTHAIVRNNLVPVFCDINDIDYTIDVNKIESLITDKTVAILPVHVYGNVCDVYKIQEIADKYNLKVIYDAAHVFGVVKDGINVANFGDASMFSFHATKVFNSIEGGAVTFKDESLVQALNDTKYYGLRGQDDIAFIGGNANMNEFQAAMGLCNLRHIEDEIKKRRQVDKKYRELLSGIKGIRICKKQENVKLNYSYFPVVFDNYKYSRDEILEKLKMQGINARKYFYPLSNNISCYADFPTADVSKTPVAKYISDRVLTLPLYADLELKDVERICEIIKN